LRCFPPGVFHIKGQIVLAIIDYEAGNLTSVERAVKLYGAECPSPRTWTRWPRPSKVIFPGVGAAGATMATSSAWAWIRP
jgi:imidazoleglycerol phosphate synthase glutamine amidotransferase subunit HisH